MTFLASLAIVIVCLGLALIAVHAVGGHNWKRRIVDIVIGTAATFAGVFLGLGLDDLRKASDDRQFARTALHTALIGFTEEMRLWHQEAVHFPKIALSTPDPEQQRLLFESFATYIKETKLDIPHTIDDLLKNERAIESFDDVVQWSLLDQGIRLRLAGKQVYEAASVKGRYAAYHAVLALSGSAFTTMCMQSAYLGRKLSSTEFDLFLQRPAEEARVRDAGCLPAWNARSFVSELLNRAGRAGEQINALQYSTPY